MLINGDEMKEIQEIINNKVQSMINDGSIQKSIEESIAKSIQTAIKSQFDSWGSITKQIEEAMKEGLKINIKDIPFESYNEQMLVAVKSRLSGLFKCAASEKFMEEMDKVLAPAPKEMAMKEFVETVAETWKTDEPWDANDIDEYATVEIERNEYDSVSLQMWKQKESSSSYSSHSNPADLQLYIIKGAIRISHKQSYNPTCFSEHEAFVFKLYAAGTILTGIDDFDPDDCDLMLKECD